jgi:hypothetical protein
VKFSATHPSPDAISIFSHHRVHSIIPNMYFYVTIAMKLPLVNKKAALLPLFC